MGSSAEHTREVAAILAALAGLGPVAPEDRAALRAAVARLRLTDAPAFRLVHSDGPSPWMSTIEVADALRVSPDKVRRMCAAGEFGHDGAVQLRRRKGSPWRVSRHAVHMWVRRAMGGVA